MKRILVPLDFSSVSAVILRHAETLAKAMKARLWLLHVATPEPEFIGYGPGPQSVRDQVAARFRKEHRLLQRKASQLEAKGVSTVPLLVQGATVDTVLAEAQRIRATLIIVGSHGHGALYRALLGSVSQGIIAKAPCPVLVVPSRRPAKPRRRNQN